MNKKPLIVLAGATAVGKTELSIQLAKAVNGEIISADSMQVYRGMNIGTAKITPSEMQGIPHYLIDEIDPADPYNVFEFQKRANSCIDNLLSRGKIPILVGGTGFYIQSVLYDIDFTETNTDSAYRRELEQLVQEKGPLCLHAMLAEIDPESAALIHANNSKRVIRALEFYHQTGTRISVHNALQRQKESTYQYAYFVLNRSRSTIYQRINQRVDQMIQNGLVEEVEKLLKNGVPETAVSMQGLGYKEMILYLKGDLPLPAAVEKLKLNTRHFAKRQITWFKREPDAIWIQYEDFPDTDHILEELLRILKEKNIVSIS